MNRCELANSYHDQGYNCCQSIVAAFADKTGLDFATSVNVSEGFGGGAGSGELCGALSGAIMVLGLMNPVDPEDVVGSKRRVMKLSKELQNRFREQFEAVRCTDLLKNRNIALTREKLISNVWGYDFFGDDRTLDTHIKLLRKNLGSCSGLIVTLRGVGYRFEAE